ncbi:MAG: MFS transporter [Nocardioides sp.]|uniref:MFS transporter n=1 Tax=Nocardioides sp. TaxID=35761 RepID=UPI003F11158E
MTEQTRSSAADDRQARWILAALCFGGLSAALMQTLVIPIQGDLPALLGTSRSNASWVVTATLLAGAVVMPVAGRLGDMYGRQRVLAASAALMAAGSVVCALSDTVVPLLVGRAMQGLAMGYIPVAISLVREVMPPRRVPTAISVISATMGVGGAIAMPLAAWIAQEHDWHALFLVSTVVSLMVLTTTLLVIPHIRPAGNARLDVPGALGLAVGLGGVLVGVSKGNEWGWGSPATLGCLLGGLAVLVGWGRYQIGQREPLVDLRLNAQGPVLITNLAAMLVGFGMMASSIVVPQLLILPAETGHGLGLTLLESGLWMTPGGLVMLVLAPYSGRLIGLIGARATLAIGAGVLTASYVFAAFNMSEPWHLLVTMCVGSAGVALAYAAMPTLILDHVPLSGAGAAVGLNGLMRSVGTTCAGAAMAAVLSSRTMEFAGSQVPTQTAFTLCFVVGVVACLVGAGVALAIPRGQAAGSH